MAKSRSRSARKRPTSASKAKSKSRPARRPKKKNGKRRGRHRQFETSVRRDRTQDSGASADRERRRTRQARDQGARGLPAGIQPPVPAFDGFPDQGSEHHAVIGSARRFPADSRQALASPRELLARRVNHPSQLRHGRRRQSDAARERPSEFVHGLAGDVVRGGGAPGESRPDATASRSPGGPAPSPSIRSGSRPARARDAGVPSLESGGGLFPHGDEERPVHVQPTRGSRAPPAGPDLADACAPRSTRDARRSCRCRTSSEPDSSRTSCSPDAHGGGFPPDPWLPAIYQRRWDCPSASSNGCPRAWAKWR